MFCVECGKEKPIFRDGVCLECYLKNHSFSHGPEVIDLPVCSHCNSYKYKSTWTSELFNEVIRKIIKNTFNISSEFKKIDINTECNEKKEGLECIVHIAGYLEDIEITEEHEIFIRLKKTVCDVCSKRFGGYHEAIVQIRADKRKLTKEEIENIKIDIETIVENLQAKGNRSLFITDVGEEHGGLNFYLSDKGSAQVITKKIQSTYGGIIKQSSKNIGMKDSRQLYRMTYLIRLPIFKKDDFISYNNSFFYITSISGNKIHIADLSNWVKQVLDLKEIQNANIIGGKEIIKEMILVSQTKKDVQVMDQNTYAIFEIAKPRAINFESKMIKLVKIEDKLYLFYKKHN